MEILKSLEKRRSFALGMEVEILFGAFSAPKRLGTDSPPEGNAQIKINMIIDVSIVTI